MSRQLDKAIAEALGWERHEGLWQGPKKELEISWPDYSTDGNAMLELDGEMRERGWDLALRNDVNYLAVYYKDHPGQKAIAHTEPLARALAAYKALTGREWSE